MQMWCWYVNVLNDMINAFGMVLNDNYFKWNVFNGNDAKWSMICKWD